MNFAGLLGSWFIMLAMSPMGYPIFVSFLIFALVFSLFMVFKVPKIQNNFLRQAIYILFIPIFIGAVILLAMMTGYIGTRFS